METVMMIPVSGLWWGWRGPQDGAEGPEGGGVGKDDKDKETIGAYYILFASFILLGLMGIVNLVLAFRIKRFSRPIFTFYFTSEIVILFRALLFSDPIADYGVDFYVYILVAMPSYLNLFVGLSQVMLNLELIVKYRNFEMMEKQQLSFDELKAARASKKRILAAAYLVLFSAMSSCIVIFVWMYVMAERESPSQEGMKTYVGPLPLAVLNVLVWLLLITTTIKFMNLLNRRFGDSEFSGPKCRLVTFLTVFSVSFLIRGAFDFWQQWSALNMSHWPLAATEFCIYFLTEWLPIFVIYINHAQSFYKRIRSSFQRRQQTPQQPFSLTIGGDQINADVMPFTKQEELSHILVDYQNSPKTSEYMRRPKRATSNLEQSPKPDAIESPENFVSLQKSKSVSLASPAKSPPKDAKKHSGSSHNQSLPNHSEISSAEQSHKGKAAPLVVEDDVRTEHGEQRLIVRYTMASHTDGRGQTTVSILDGQGETREDNQVYLHENVNQMTMLPIPDGLQRATQLSMYNQEQAGQSVLIPHKLQMSQYGHRPRADLVNSHTLQPISSDNGAGETSCDPSANVIVLDAATRLGGSKFQPAESIASEGQSHAYIRHTELSEDVYVHERTQFTSDIRVVHTGAKIQDTDNSLWDTPRDVKVSQRAVSRFEFPHDEGE